MSKPIRQLREQAGLTRRQLAESIDRPEWEVARWELGWDRLPLEAEEDLIRVCWDAYRQQESE